MTVSGYGLWVKENRPAIAEEVKRDPCFLEKNHKEQLGAIAKAVGQKWTELDVEVKTQYESTAAAENAKIREERACADAAPAPRQEEVQVQSSASTVAATPPPPRRHCDTAAPPPKRCRSGLQPAEEARLKELQALKQKAIASVEDRPDAAHIFLQDVAERAKMATEVLGEETMMAKMKELWSNMSDEQRKVWESKIQAEKLHAWEQAPESASTPQKLAAPQHDEEPADLGFDDESLKRARRKGLEASMVCLARRSEIKALQLSGSELFEAIRKSGGLVNAAKNSLLAERQITSQEMPAVKMLV